MVRVPCVYGTHQEFQTALLCESECVSVCVKAVELDVACSPVLISEFWCWSGVFRYRFIVQFNRHAARWVYWITENTFLVNTSPVTVPEFCDISTHCTDVEKPHSVIFHSAAAGLITQITNRAVIMSKAWGFPSACNNREVYKRMFLTCEEASN